MKRSRIFELASIVNAIFSAVAFARTVSSWDPATCTLLKNILNAISFIIWWVALSIIFILVFRSKVGKK